MKVPCHKLSNYKKNEPPQKKNKKTKQNKTKQRKTQNLFLIFFYKFVTFGYTNLHILLTVQVCYQTVSFS